MALGNGNRKGARPGVLVIWNRWRFFVKRIEPVPHFESSSVVLRSLNPEYDSYERRPEAGRVVGHAVWLSGRL